jgi:hypothetical protein
VGWVKIFAIDKSGINYLTMKGFAIDVRGFEVSGDGEPTPPVGHPSEEGIFLRYALKNRRDREQRKSSLKSIIHSLT